MVRAVQAADRRLRRCPACGQRVDPASPDGCSLCGRRFGDSRVTGADVTPYSRSYACGYPGWRRMVEWVWFAELGRLTHLALMRSSAASRRFAMINILLLSGGAALFQATRIGWLKVTNAPAIQPIGSTRPEGVGWLDIATAPFQPSSVPDSMSGVDLWWNPAQSVIAFATSGPAGLVLILLLMRMINGGVSLAHASPYRGEQRMTAAVQYSTAWGVPIFLAAVIMGLRPISYVGMAASWRWYPPEKSFILSAATLAGFGLAMWWFWLVRLGATAPARTRKRVVTFFAVGVPLLLTATAAGWWYGLEALYPPFFEMLDISF